RTGPARQCAQRDQVGAQGRGARPAAAAARQRQQRQEKRDENDMMRELILEAIVELQRRKLRTGLTLLGMVFGVGAIVAMLAVGEGSKREALRLVSELGLNNVLVEAKSIAPDRVK